MTDRVMVFVDYQNSYHSARELFHHPSDTAPFGQFHPGSVGRLIVARSPFERSLVGVRIYRGLPSDALIHLYETRGVT